MAMRDTSGKPTFNICRLRPERLRAMPRKNLERVWNRLFEYRRTRERNLAWGYVNALLWTKLPPNQGTKRQKGHKAAVATRLEWRIREIQAARCPR